MGKILKIDVVVEEDSGGSGYTATLTSKRFKEMTCFQFEHEALHMCASLVFTLFHAQEQHDKEHGTNWIAELLDLMGTTEIPTQIEFHISRKGKDPMVSIVNKDDKQLLCVIIRVGEDPKITRISNRLKDLQSCVDGYIELAGRCGDYLWYANEEGRLLNMKDNIVSPSGEVLVGPVLITKKDDTLDNITMTEEEARSVIEYAKARLIRDITN